MLVDAVIPSMPPDIDSVLTAAALYVLTGNDFVPTHRGIGPYLLVEVFGEHGLLICDIDAGTARDPLVTQKDDICVRLASGMDQADGLLCSVATLRVSAALRPRTVSGIRCNTWR
jgi:hypothetical protein